MGRKPEEILKEARENRHWTQSDIAEKIGISSRQYQNYEEGKFPKFKTDVVIALDMLLGTRLHEMIYEKSVPRATNGKNPSSDAGDEPMGIITEPEINYQEKRRAQKLATVPFLVPLVPVKAQAGYARSYDNTDFINNLESYPILPGINPRGAIWRYFEVEGDSMVPSLYPKDVVLVSMVPPEDWKDIKGGQAYVVVIGDDVVVKIVYPISKDIWILASSNKRVKQRKVNVSDIKELWQYRGRTTRGLSIPKIDIKV